LRDKPHTIDFWSFSLNCEPELVSRAEKLLTKEEKAQTGHFRFEHHRRRFIVRRSMRRVLIAHLNGIEPGEVRIVAPHNEKPRLRGNNNVSEFNSSHSGDRAVIVTAKCPLGVDLEALDRPIDVIRFARHSFTNDEYRDIRQHHGNTRQLAFFNCWTGKEAYVKALGLGLSKKLRSFSVHCAADEPPGLRWDRDRRDSSGPPRFFRCTDTEFVATVVAEAPSDAITVALHELSTASLLSNKPVEATGPGWRES
jgi:4'-phosphopantetheinyl transferase